MHLKSILLLFVFLLILPPLETAAQNQDTAFMSDSAYEARYQQVMQLQIKKLEREKNRQIFELKDQERSLKNKRLIVIILIVAAVLIFLTGLVLIVLWIVRKN